MVYTNGASKPTIFEEWNARFDRTVAASHVVVWESFIRARREAERAYQEFLDTNIASRVNVRPQSPICATSSLS